MVLRNVGGLAHGKLNREDAKRPDIDLVIVLSATFNQFRGHPTDRANFTLTTLLLLGEDNCVSKIGKFDLTVSFDKDVVGFNVTVDDVLSMQVDETFECLVNTILAELLGVLARKLLEHGSECTTVHQLHEDPESILEVKRFVALHDRFA